MEDFSEVVILIVLNGSPESHLEVSQIQRSVRVVGAGVDRARMIEM